MKISKKENHKKTHKWRKKYRKCKCANTEFWFGFYNVILVGGNSSLTFSYMSEVIAYKNFSIAVCFCLMNFVFMESLYYWSGIIESDFQYQLLEPMMNEKKFIGSDIEKNGLKQTFVVIFTSLKRLFNKNLQKAAYFCNCIIKEIIN